MPNNDDEENDGKVNVMAMDVSIFFETNRGRSTEVITAMEENGNNTRVGDEDNHANYSDG